MSVLSFYLLWGINKQILRLPDNKRFMIPKIHNYCFAKHFVSVVKKFFSVPINIFRIYHHQVFAYCNKSGSFTFI